MHLGPFDKASCEHIIDGLNPEDIGDIRSGESDNDTRCARVVVGDRIIRIITTCCVWPGPPAGQIVSARVDGLIIIADPVRD